MRIDIDLPWGGKLHFEREPMSEDARYTRNLALGLFGFMAFFLVLIYMLR